MRGTVRRGAALVMSAAFVTGCQDASPETSDTQDRLSQVCETFDVGEVDGLRIPAAAETRVVPGVFLDGYGWCTVRLDGARAVSLTVEYADSWAGQSALERDEWKTADLSVADGTGFIGRVGPADDAGGRAVLGDDARVVRVNVEPSVIVEGADPARAAGDVAVNVRSRLHR